MRDDAVRAAVLARAVVREPVDRYVVAGRIRIAKLGVEDFDHQRDARDAIDGAAVAVLILRRVVRAQDAALHHCK